MTFFSCMLSPGHFTSAFMIQVSIADQLHVDGVCSFSIYIFVLVVMRATDTNMGAIDAPDDFGEARHGIEFGFGNLGITCATLCTVRHTVALLMPNVSPTSIWNPADANTRNATMICIASANPPFRNWADSNASPNSSVL